MKIAILNSSCAVTPFGGVRVQGLMWADGLSKLGHEVSLVNFWDVYNWEAFDAIIVISSSGYFSQVMPILYKRNKRIFVAPIIDPSVSLSLYSFYAHFCLKIPKFGMIERPEHRNLYMGCQYGYRFLTRSLNETQFLSKSCDISVDRIDIVPLSIRFDPLRDMPQKENFCFHCSRLRSENKNVSRLIMAAKMYDFRLVLAGDLHGDREREWLYEQIYNYPNIEYIGPVDDDTLKEYYMRAKVFALPSITEGVGMVALEAAAYGCEIVLTNIGAPKEYWGDYAELVDPYSVDHIGQAIVKLLKHGKSQPKLLSFIEANYSLRACSEKLVYALQK